MDYRAGRVRVHAGSEAAGAEAAEAAVAESRQLTPVLGDGELHGGIEADNRLGGGAAREVGTVRRFRRERDGSQRQGCGQDTRHHSQSTSADGGGAHRGSPLGSLDRPSISARRGSSQAERSSSTAI